MISIWKYPLTTTDELRIEMPIGSDVLTVQLQGGTPTLWALVDTGRPKIARTFRIFGTGHDIPTVPGRYIGTYQLNGGNLVFHLFEG